MKRFAVSLGTATSIGVVAFFAGKHMQEQQAKAQSESRQQEILNRNTHTPNAVLPPFRRITYPHFNILYSTYHRSPIAVHEILTKDIINGDAPRSKFFFPEQTIHQKHLQVDQSFFYQTEAFKRFNVNRGHMAAAGNYSGNESQKFHTFSFANVIPQNGYNNGGIWNTFERYTRKLVLGPHCESVEVISGPVYLKETPSTVEGEEKEKTHRERLIVLKENGIPIPERLYKIIKCNPKEGRGKPYLSAFLFLNSETYDNNRTLLDFKTSLQEVQRLTGLHFAIKDRLQLQQIDVDLLKTTKKDLDHEFYFGLMSSSTTIAEMQEGYRRAREQKIEIDFKLLTEKIRGMAGKEIGELKQESMLQCDKLGKLVRLKKKLYQLYHKEETRDLWEGEMEGTYTACVGSQNNAERASYKKLREQLGEDISKLIK